MDGFLTMRRASRHGARGHPVPGAAGRIVLVLALALWLAALGAGGEEAPGEETAAVTNPFFGQEDAIQEGERIYRKTCIGCHRSTRGHGPSIFRIRERFSDQQFMETVTNGRNGTNMPAWGKLLSRDEIWKVHAFVNSRDRL
jgi:mono/diheme cytochrome c family protein